MYNYTSLTAILLKNKFYELDEVKRLFICKNSTEGVPLE